MLLRKLDYDLVSLSERQALYRSNIMLGLVFRCDQLQSFESILTILNELREAYGSGTFPPLLVIGTFWDRIPEAEKSEIEQKVKQILLTVGLTEFYYVAANPPINLPVVFVRYTQFASSFYGYPDGPQTPYEILLIGNAGTGKNTLIQRFKDLGYASVEESDMDDMELRRSEEENAPPKPRSFSSPPSPPGGAGGFPSPMSAPAAASIAPSPSPPPPSSEKKVERRQDEKPRQKEEQKADKMKKKGASKTVAASDMMSIEFEEREEDSDMDEAELSFGGLEPTLPTKYQKNLAVEYFDKMNPEKYYPLIVNIANVEQAYVAPQENIVTGERKIQKKEVMEVELVKPRVTVRPVFPGCSIAPSEIVTDFDQVEDELEFFITPMVKDDINGHIDFLDGEGQIVYQMPLHAQVDDPRYAKTIAAYGTLASMLPKLLLFFDIDIGNEMSMESLVPLMGSVLGGALARITLTNFIAFAGVFLAFIIGGIIFIKRKPRSTKMRFTLGDLRVKKLMESNLL